MAPRRRSRKGETRMDAALDTMSPYGFPKKLVRQTVHHLLKVYGGSDGWVFIEDSAYSLLIDTLLEKQATASTSASPHDGLIEDNPGDGHNEAPPAGCSNRALLPCSNTETFDDSSLTNQAIDTVSAASETGNQLPIKAANTVSATCETDCQPPANLAVGGIHGSPLACSTPLQTKPPLPVKSLCHKRRRPCHGWISDDDEEEELEVLSPEGANEEKERNDDKHGIIESDANKGQLSIDPTNQELRRGKREKRANRFYKNFVV